MRKLLQHKILYAQPSDIKSVMVDGKFIMRNHRVLTVDEAAIMEEAYQIGQRVWGRML